MNSSTFLHVLTLRDRLRLADCGLRPKFGAAHRKAVPCDVRGYIALDRPDRGLRPKFGAAHKKVVSSLLI